MDLDTLKRLREFADIDTTRDDFLNSFYVNYMKLFPEGAIVDKAFVLKHITEFYLSRGSANSVKFLLRILYNQEIDDIYLPKTDVLKSSDGKWFIGEALESLESVLASRTLILICWHCAHSFPKSHPWGLVDKSKEVRL
jgi:hypothetical protein